MSQIRLEDLPLIVQLENVLLDELDSQHLNGRIEPGATGDAYFDVVDGDLSGRPDWNAVVKAVVSALWEETGR
jgi:hypothetical protein